MKKISVSVLAFLFLSISNLTAVVAQKQVSLSASAMPMNTKSQQAKKLGMSGLAHMMNVEREFAYNDFKAAVEMDPNFSLALAYLANLSFGDAQTEYARRAMETAKTEGEKLYAQIVQKATTPDERRQAWAQTPRPVPGRPR